MRTASLLPLAGVVGLLLIWFPVGAFSITFLEPTHGLNDAGTALAIGLLDPGILVLRDLVTIGIDQATAGSLGVAPSYESSASPPLLLPADGLTVSTPETGFQQNALSLVLPLAENGPLDLNASARAAMEPGVLQSVPEPATLLLFGLAMVGLGIACRRR
jgi:hypothetical protein